MVLDVLVFGGGFKLEVSLLLGQAARLGNITGSDLYKMLPRSLGPELFFESLFFPKRATMMNGPLFNTLRGGCPLLCKHSLRGKCLYGLHHIAALRMAVPQTITVAIGASTCKLPCM